LSFLKAPANAPLITDKHEVDARYRYWRRHILITIWLGYALFYPWLTNVANGPHTLMVEASDKAGNKTTQKLDFTIDTILSEPTIT
ncbi:Ig-like domain-containing protein, partial [Salmonella enterica subsp. enterica serovar Anatum]|nr:Ig-like domain-containing protein [Salmonella enterica subsp. enterica serovar Anatum]